MTNRLQQHHPTYRWLPVFWLIATVLLLCLPAAPIHATEPAGGVQVFAVRQQDANNDGQPDITIIDCAFATERDQVRVYDRGGNMVASDDWHTATDFTDDVWVFDVGADGSAQLLITFQQTADGLLAELWDDRDNDGRVTHRPPPNLQIRELPWAPVRVLAPDGWWQQDTRPNFNLQITVDGPIRASFAYPSFERFLRLDGSTDFTITVRDDNRDGRPEWQWVDAWPAAPPASGVMRVEAIQNVDDDEYPITGSIFWHYLGSGEQYTKDYLISPPPIQMNWDTATLATVGEFVASRFNDNVWFVYSQYRPDAGEAVPASFEAPFAFYDLAADDDGYPELQVRMVAYPPEDRYANPNNPHWMQHIRYSWDQDNATSWDYKLELVGQHPIDTIARLPDFDLQMVPYEDLPAWITGRTWTMDFVAIEPPIESYWTSEGIYETPTDPSDLLTYQQAQRDTLPPRNAALPLGLRTEATNPAAQHTPMLYFSPLDRKLHLRHAESGYWYPDQASAVYYDNLDGDAYLDQWIYVRQLGTTAAPRTLVRQINLTPQHLLYSDSERAEVLIREVAVPPSLFEAPPPTTHAEWQQLGTQLAQHQREFDPAALDAMAEQFAGATTALQGARLRDFRYTNAGYRYVIELEPNFRATGSLATGFAGLSPGAYLIEHLPQMQISPLEPPALALTLHIAPRAATTQHLLPRAVELHNAGTDDAAALRLRVDATSAEGTTDASTTILSQTITVQGKATEWVAFDWQPPAAGTWDVVATLTDQQGQTVASSSQRETVPARAAVTTSEVLLLSTPPDRWWHGLLLLGLISALVVVSIVLSVGNPSRAGRSEQ